MLSELTKYSRSAREKKSRLWQTSWEVATIPSSRVHPCLIVSIANWNLSWIVYCQLFTTRQVNHSVRVALVDYVSTHKLWHGVFHFVSLARKSSCSWLHALLNTKHNLNLSRHPKKTLARSFAPTRACAGRFLTRVTREYSLPFSSLQSQPLFSRNNPTCMAPSNILS